MSNRSIYEAINKITGQNKVDQVTYINAIVESVNLKNRTCYCIAIDGNAEYELPNVKLMAVIDDGILIEPEIGSTVKVIFSVNVEPQVTQYSEIKNITLIANEKINISGLLLTLNDGSFGGIVKVTELVDKLNAIENDLNNLKKAFTDWVVIPSDGGGALKTIATTWSGQEITITKVVELENNTLLHGR